jgi:hypothetical protein
MIPMNRGGVRAHIEASGLGGCSCCPADAECCSLDKQAVHAHLTPVMDSVKTAAR